MSNIIDSFSTQFDFPPLQPMSNSFEGKTIMFATTPRSGSTHICNTFWRTGVIGSPLEYLNHRINHSIKEKIDRGDFSLYWQELKIRRTSPNGIFSFKMFPDLFLEIIDQYGELVEKIDFDHVVFIIRKSIIDQAVSYVRARQTNRWFFDQSEKVSPYYSYEFIRNCIITLNNRNLIWKEIFNSKEISYYSIIYEEFVDNQNLIISNLFKELNIVWDGSFNLETPHIKNQSDQKNSKWSDMFYNEMMDRSDQKIIEIVDKHCVAG